MTPRLRLFAFLLLAGLILPLSPRAQDQSDGTLHVLRPSINAEQDGAELCLELDHTLDLKDRGRILAGIHLESNGKPVPVSPANVNLAAPSLCIQSLAHRQDYSLTLADLRGANGEKLAGPYKLSFTVPDRHPSLAFAGDPHALTLARYGNSDPVLHAINVARVRVMLYRITDPARMAEAYRQRMQTTLAPSESLTFAKNNGALVWQGELVLDDSEDKKFANQSLEYPVPLRAAAGSIAPGLYLVAAQDTAPPAKTKPATFAPLAAQWFMRSSLRIEALATDGGFFAVAEKTDDPAPAKDVRLLVLDHDQQTLAEGKSDATGLVFLPVAEDRRAGAATLLGLTEAGDAAFADVSAGQGAENQQSQFSLPSLDSSLTADRPFYLPGDAMTFMLTAHNIYGGAVATPGSLIQFLRPDHSLYATLPVPDGAAGVSWLSFPAPAITGTWSASWHQADGRVLAQAPLRITIAQNAPRLEMTADHSLLDNGGELNLVMKSVTDAGAPEPYIAGHILVQWTQPDTLAAWNDYHFGNGEKTDAAALIVAAFVTDANGVSRAHLALKIPQDGAPLHAAVISVRSDAASGALDPDPLTLQMKPSGVAIGIKPLATGGKFAENSQAKFDVIALDGDGNRRAADNLEYQIYEEGRSFNWYQTDGRWDYKPLQQRRRIGGGALAIKAESGAAIHWPVTAGSYTLEITDAGGASLARLYFDAGWGLPQPSDAKPADLALKPETATVEPGAPAKIAFTLDHPSMITAVIADDRIRKVIHETRPAGANTLEFTPEENWGNRLRVRVEATGTGEIMPVLAGDVTLMVRANAEDLNVTALAPDHAAAGQDLALAVTAANIKDRKPVFVNVLATPFAGGEGDAPPVSVAVKNASADADGKAVIHFPAPAFSGTLRLKIIASNDNQWGQKELAIPVRPPFAADLVFPPLLRTDDVVRVPLDLKNNDAPADAYRYILSAAPGLKLTGPADDKADFSQGARRTVSFDLEALQAGARDIRLDLTGSQGFRLNRTWTAAVTDSGWAFDDSVKAQIEPQQSWPPPAEKAPGGKVRTRAKPLPEFLFVSPQPLFDAPQILQAMLETEPFTTSEIAAWLETARLWHDAIVTADLLPQSVLQARQQRILQLLLTRQQSDGSFPVLPGGESDITATADALSVLAHADQALARAAVDAAASWLSQKLANTWFEEKERAPRAAGFAGLAAADRLDVSALRYFAETSDGKTLPPLAAAQLAAALAKSGDQDKASAWLKAVIDRNSPALWPVLAENPLFEPRDLLPVLQKFSGDFARALHDPEALAAFLRALAAVEARSGGWRAAINGSENDHAGVLVMPPSEKPAPAVIRNVMDRPLSVLESARVKRPAKASATVITRHFFRSDGNEIAPDQLRQGDIYLIMLEAPWPSALPQGTPLFLHAAPAGGLKVHGCALDGAAGLAQGWTWLGNLAPVSSCATSAYGLDAVIAAPAGGGNTWRIAYLAEAARGGIFHPAMATARAPDSDLWMTSGNQRIEIR